MGPFLDSLPPWALGLAALVFVFLGVFLGVLAGAFMAREDMRIAQRGVDEARAHLASAGLGHLAFVPASRPAVPSELREEVTP
jgi:hypothetical protein